MADNEQPPIVQDEPPAPAPDPPAPEPPAPAPDPPAPEPPAPAPAKRRIEVDEEEFTGMKARLEEIERRSRKEPKTTAPVATKARAIDRLHKSLFGR